MTLNSITIFMTHFDRLHIDGEPFIPVERHPTGLFLLGEWHPHTGLFLSDRVIRAGLDDQSIRIELRSDPETADRS